MYMGMGVSGGEEGARNGVHSAVHLPTTPPLPLPRSSWRSLAWCNMAACSPHWTTPLVEPHVLAWVLVLFSQVGGLAGCCRPIVDARRHPGGLPAHRGHCGEGCCTGQCTTALGHVLDPNAFLGVLRLCRKSSLFQPQPLRHANAGTWGNTCCDFWYFLRARDKKLVGCCGVQHWDAGLPNGVMRCQSAVNRGPAPLLACTAGMLPS